jgi:glycosyltransferase involved in cell wall biosynthesis
MKIVLIGPGLSPIPPTGWGAVESMVWDYYEEFSKRGHIVIIVNIPNLIEMIDATNEANADLVYIMYDDHIVLAPHIKCNHIYYMSHYAYITEPGFEDKRGHYFHNIFKKVIENQKYITLNAISSEILDVYRAYGYTGKANVINNGARANSFRYTENPVFSDRSIYIGKIEDRKGQYKYQSIRDLYFVGNYYNSPFDQSNPNYLGEWTKPVLYESLTDYGNLVLLSNGEADPLVVKEGLIAGLGVVVSECSAANLDRSLPFITVIPDYRILDRAYISEKIAENRQISISMRPAIREYALSKFSWSSIIDRVFEVYKNRSLRIALIGPGIMPIPPVGWGAVEILIWDYYRELIRLGHKVIIINTPDREQIVSLVNRGKFEFVHLHYDVFWGLLDRLNCPKIAITSHYPYIDQVEKHMGDGYSTIFSFLTTQKKYMNFVLAEKDAEVFKKGGADPNTIYKIKNGINSSAFRFVENPMLRDRSIYLGKITPRKNQAKYQKIAGIDFVGGCHDSLFDTSQSNFLGEWTRERIYKDLTEYGNMVLLSEGEADPLVIKEGLIAGLGIVVNRSSAENLDLTLDFITVIEDNKMEDIDYISEKIAENREFSLRKRSEIREYGISHFDIQVEVQKYIDIICLPR